MNTLMYIGNELLNIRKLSTGAKEEVKKGDTFECDDICYKRLTKVYGHLFDTGEEKEETVIEQQVAIRAKADIANVDTKNMTEKELSKYAKDNKIDVSKAKSKDEIKETIKNSK